jgi:hypothetical protein
VPNDTAIGVGCDQISHSAHPRSMISRVEFVSDEIEESVWQALSTTNAVPGEEPYVHLP